MRNGLLILATLGGLYGCGSGDNGSVDGSSKSGDCAADTKVVQVTDSSVNRNSYHFFQNTCNDLIYTGSIGSGEIWGYGTDLPDTGFWTHNIQRYQLARTSDSFDLFASLPRLPDNDEKLQGAIVCSLETSVDGIYNNTTITINNSSINEFCYQKGVESPIIAKYDVGYETLTESQINQFTDIVQKGNPTQSNFTQAMSSDKLILCKVSSDEEIAITQCAN
ncbi:hypothetical protein C9I89_18320 [Photobacterium lipolyticum]|uniref:Uncharacterized protein n=2 Tax=Photobacterium lipolyticum TaxID=266810 RepID=A0A2T3MTN4_9GAMM|nr:hypothetical protein C9I89_18320 [Photobacterium lipolyticum]